jgi:hypothetical protein
MNLPRGCVAFIVLASVAALMPARAAFAEAPCGSEAALAASNARQWRAPIAARIERAIRKATALLRFDRRDEGLERLDRIIALLDGPQSERLEDRTRQELTASMRTLRGCVAGTEVPPMAALTIGAFNEDGGPDGAPGSPAGEGVYIHVEGIRLGRTGRGGALDADVPSGEIHITATEYPSSWGETVVTLSPGESRIVSIVLADSKEPSEESDLVFAEVSDGILPANPTSLSLAFVQDDVPVDIRSIESIELSEGGGNLAESFEDSFELQDGVMRATDGAAVYARIVKHSRIGRALQLSAHGIDAEGRTHDGAVSFQIGLSKLAVTLAPPPSNQALVISNIPVRVSVMGTGVALSRVSDANGHFEVDALPDATVALHAMTIAAGVYYYGDAALTLCADRSVTLFMLNVQDVVHGVPALMIDPGLPPCPPVPRR